MRSAEKFAYATGKAIVRVGFAIALGLAAGAILFAITLGALPVDYAGWFSFGVATGYIMFTD